MPQPCFQSSGLPWLSSLRVVAWPKGMFSLAVWPKGMFSLVAWPKGMFSLVVWPKGTFSLVVWPKGTFSLVVWPKGTFSLVVWPKGMFSLPRFMVRGNDQQQEQVGGAWHEVDCWRTEDLHRLWRWYGARLLSVCALGALPLAALISNLGEGVWWVGGYTGVTMSIWGYVLSGSTLCNLTQYGCATSRDGTSCGKKWAAFERGVYDENMTVSTISSELLILFKPNSVWW